MEMNLPVTLAISAVVGAVFVLAYFKGKEPAQPLKVRMINYHVVQIACIVILLVMSAHLATLLFGSQAGAGQVIPAP
jgi:hypothetical protein